MRNIILIITKLGNDLDRGHLHNTTKFQEDISTLRGKRGSVKVERFSSYATHSCSELCVIMEVHWNLDTTFPRYNAISDTTLIFLGSQMTFKIYLWGLSDIRISFIFAHIGKQVVENTGFI